MDEELERLRAQRMEDLAAQAAAPSQPVHVTDRTMPEFLRKHRVTLVDFWAAWCGPCRAMEPVIERLAERWKGLVAVAKLNTDENPSTSALFRIMSIPTVIVFRDGKPFQQLVGLRPMRDFEDVLRQATGSSPPSAAGRRL